MTAVKECLTPTEAAAVDANSLPTASTTTQGTDESILMPPPDATYLQLRHHLSKFSPYLFQHLLLSVRINWFHARHLGPSLASLGIFSGSVEKEDSNKQDIAPVDSGELDLEGIDETEMDSYIKSEAEAKMTTDMWMALNGEFMIELEGENRVIWFS